MDINQIREILPHRFKSNVTINDNFFPGHFPETPIMPGNGTGWWHSYAATRCGNTLRQLLLCWNRLSDSGSQVVAGDTLVMRMTLVKLQKQFGVAKMEGKAYVGGKLVCEGEFLMAMGS
ncbi:unnamed protein product [Camellia sinensis]